MQRGSTSATAAALAIGFAALLAACGQGSDDATSATPTTGRSTTTTGSTTTTMTVPANRPIEVEVPAGYDPDAAAPLLILLHGYGASGALQEGYLQLAPQANAAGMLYVHPDGTENEVGKRFWNATDACCAGPKAATAPNDSAYLAAVIAQVQADYHVDPKRIFLVGHSNGGFMAYRMACDHADVIAAIVSLEGATYADPEDCTPSEPVATLGVHGRSDTTIFYDGGKLGGAPYPGAEQTAKTWAAYDGCAPTPDDPAPSPRPIVKDLPSATVTSYGDCDPGGHVELWSQPEGVHVPNWNSTFARQVIAWLQQHPKP